MVERPIIFSAPMVQAIIDGRKTQTRRVLKPQPIDRAKFSGFERDGQALFTHGCYYGKQRLRFTVGDRLWVREAWRAGYGTGWYREDLGRPAKPSEFDPKTTAIEYRAHDEDQLRGRWRPGIHMPRWASRITLDVKEVRVQRLQDISEADAIAEGALLPWTGPAWDKDSDTRTGRSEFEALWNSINAKRGFGWDANPWVVALTFEAFTRPAHLTREVRR